MILCTLLLIFTLLCLHLSFAICSAPNGALSGSEFLSFWPFLTTFLTFFLTFFWLCFQAFSFQRLQRKLSNHLRWLGVIFLHWNWVCHYAIHFIFFLLIFWGISGMFFVLFIGICPVYQLQLIQIEIEGVSPSRPGLSYHGDVLPFFLFAVFIDFRVFFHSHRDTLGLHSNCGSAFLICSRWVPEVHLMNFIHILALFLSLW
jgi:hypothetical protein